MLLPTLAFLLPAALSLLPFPTLALSIHPGQTQPHKPNFRPVPLSARSESPLLFGRQLSSSVRPERLASCEACQAVYELSSVCIQDDPKGAAENDLQVPIGHCICSEQLVSQLSTCYSCAGSNGADMNYLQSGMNELSNACSNAGYPLISISLSPSPALVPTSTPSVLLAIAPVHPESALKPTPTAKPFSTQYQPSSSPPPVLHMKKTYVPNIKETIYWNSTHTASSKQAAATGRVNASGAGRVASVATGVGSAGLVCLLLVVGV